MPITKLTIQNFKSFDHVEVDLRNFNVVVGPNAAGKSNLIEAVVFLKDIAEHGLEDAVDIHGGIKMLRNFNAGGGQPLRVRVEYDGVGYASNTVVAVDERIAVDEIRNRILSRYDGKTVGVKKGRIAYDFSIRPHKSGSEFSVVHDELSQRITLFEITPVVESEEEWYAPFSQDPSYREVETLGDGALVLNQRNGAFRARLDPSLGKNIKLFDIFPTLSHILSTVSQLSLILQSPYLRMVDYYFWDAMKNARIYNFDPKKPKQAVPIASVKKLDGDGGNLAIVLQEILRRAENRRRFVNLVSDLLPFVDSVGVDRLAYNSLLAKLTERYSSGKRDLSVAWASDGTISVLAMVAALFFEKGELAVFEEPERNMPPQLIGRLVQMMKEASERKQIILTTHNPEMLRHSDLEDILLVQRDDDGNSILTRPADSETLKIFLENELGIEDLFVQNLLAI